MSRRLLLDLGTNGMGKVQLEGKFIQHLTNRIEVDAPAGGPVSVTIHYPAMELKAAMDDPDVSHRVAVGNIIGEGASLQAALASVIGQLNARDGVREEDRILHEEDAA